MRQVLRIYEADDETVALEFSTSDADPLPYLKEGLVTDEQEVDIRDCSATIGAITCELVDVPTVAGDQDSGGITAVLADEDGETRWIGHRAEFLQEPSGGGDLYPVFDGIVGSLSLLDTLVTYRAALEDITARGRKVPLFGHHETMSMIPPGPVNGFGEVRSATGVFTSYAIRPADVLEAEYVQHDATSGYFRFTMPGSQIPAAARRAVLRRPLYAEDGSYIRDVYGRMAIRWRANSADTWKTFRRVPVSSEPGWDSALQDNIVTTTNRIWVGQNPDEAVPPALPTDGQSVEIQVLYSGPPTPDFPLLFEGPAGAELKKILDGEYSPVWDEGTGAYVPQPLRIRYDTTRMTALADEVEDLFAEITEPAEDAREWLQEHWFGAFGYLPTIREGLLYPIRLEMPDAAPTLVLDNTNVESARWSHERADAVTVVEYVFNRIEMVRVGASYLPDLNTFIGPDFDAPDGTLVPTKREVRQEFRSSSAATIGEEVVRIQPVTVMELAGRGGRGDSQTRSAQSISQRRGRHLIDRLRFGAQRVTVKASRHDPEVDAANVGDWAILGATWVPEYSTLTRGANRLTQIVAARNVDQRWREFVLLDAGSENQPLDPPTIGALVAHDDGTVDIPVATIPEGEAAVYYAVADAQPAAGSGLWLLASRIAAPGTVTTPPLAAGANVFVRVRAEAEGRIYSSSVYDDVTLAQVPRVSNVRIELTNGIPTVRWDPNPFALGVRITYSTETDPIDPALDQTLDADAMDESAPLPVFVPADYMIVARVTPYSGWTGAAVSGTAGDPEQASASSVAAATRPTVTDVEADEQVVTVRVDANALSVRLQRVGGAGWNRTVDLGTLRRVTFDVSQPDGNGNSGIGAGATWEMEAQASTDPASSFDDGLLSEVEPVVVVDSAATPAVFAAQAIATAPAVGSDDITIKLHATTAYDPALHDVHVFAYVQEPGDPQFVSLGRIDNTADFSPDPNSTGNEPDGVEVTYTWASGYQARAKSGSSDIATRFEFRCKLVLASTGATEASSIAPVSYWVASA